MNRKEAKDLSLITLNSNLKMMFVNAAEKIIDWSEPSRVNKHLSKGFVFNLFLKSGNDYENLHDLVKLNMIFEFGEFLPNYEKPIKKKKQKITVVNHQKPDFTLL